MQKHKTACSKGLTAALIHLDMHLIMEDVIWMLTGKHTTTHQNLTKKRCGVTRKPFVFPIGFPIRVCIHHHSQTRFSKKLVHMTRHKMPSSQPPGMGIPHLHMSLTIPRNHHDISSLPTTPQITNNHHQLLLKSIRNHAHPSTRHEMLQVFLLWWNIYESNALVIALNGLIL